MVNDKYNIKQRNFDIMRNSKSQGEALYEKIMSELEPIVKTVLGEAMGVKKPMNKQLNELSLPTMANALTKAARYGNIEYVDDVVNKLETYRIETKMNVDCGPVRIITIALSIFTDNLSDYDEDKDKWVYITNPDEILYDIDIDYYDESFDEIRLKGDRHGWGTASFKLKDDFFTESNNFVRMFNRTDAKRIADWVNKQMNSHLSWRNFYGPAPLLRDDVNESKKIPKSKKLNEMSDDMLNRAIVAAVDKGDFERAKKFSDYRKSDIRKENLNKIPFKKGELDTRSINFLKANGINSPYQLLNMTKDEFYALKPGKKTMMMILDYLDGYFNDTHLNKYYR